MRKLLLIYFLSCLSLCLKSQSKSPFFYHLFADYGLSSDKTTSIIQDYLGFIWFGTEEGLNRVNGYNDFEIYKHSRSDSTTLSNNYITVLFEDSQQRLWVGTKDGLNLFDRNRDKFRKVNVLGDFESASGISVVDIKEDEEGDLWMILNQHLVEIDGTTHKKLSDLKVSDLSNTETRLSVLQMFESRLWVGSSEGLFVVSDDRLNRVDMLQGKPISSLLSTDKKLWIGTYGSGLFEYRNGGLKEYAKNSSQGIISDFVNDIAVVNQRDVWVTTNNGVSVINPSTGKIFHYQHDFDNAYSLSDPVLRDVYQDRSGVVWISTPNSGVNFYHEADNLFDYYGQTRADGTDNDLMDYALFSIFSARDGGVWLGSRRGMSRLDPSTNKFVHYPFPKKLSNDVNGILSIGQCSADYLWLGTNNGLVKWRNSRKGFEYIMPTQLKGHVVNTVMVDENDNVWLGTEEHGVKLYASVSRMLRHVDFMIDGVKMDLVPSIRSIKKFNEMVLVATGKGLFKFEKGILVKVPFNGFKKLPDDIPINEVYKDSKDRIWVGTQEDGALLLDNDLKVVKVYDKKSGLKAQDIRSIVEDDQGVMWLSTNDGVTKLRVGVDSLEKVSVNNYDISDGLQGNQFSARAASKSNDNRIFMGGLSGLTELNPMKVKDFEIKQNPNFIRLTVNDEKVKAGEENSPLDRSIALIDDLILGCEQNNFLIEFSALDYVRPDDVLYRYKLTNYDDDWIETKIGQASYKEIPTGKNYDFVFQSKGRLSGGWSEERVLSIRVQPHPYQSLWFRVLMVLLIVGLIVLFFWLREQRLKRKRQQLELLVDERSSELHKEIGERKRVEAKLRSALEDAEDANQIKNKFLANMSHEIRTPLNGIMGLTQLSLESDLDREQEDILKTISSSADSLKSIVDDILDIAKIESGSLEVVIEPFGIKDLLKEIVSSFSYAAEEKNITLKHWILPDVPAYVEGDAKHIRQVLVNLVSNAVKFTHSGGVTIFAEALIKENTDEVEIWFTVTDTGIGIQEAHQEGIFESFSQVDTGNTREYGGTGLGLSISKELVAKMRGEIWVESEENKGSIFKFYVPVKVFEMEEESISSYPENIKPKANVLGKVLLVEDNPTNQKVASKMLKNKGMEVICAENGVIAVETLLNEDIDVILMDLQMPVMDGYEATRKIRELDGAKSKTPIIALTAAVMTGEKEKCFAAGMNDYLTKPVNYNLLVKTVNSYLLPNQELELS